MYLIMIFILFSAQTQRFNLEWPRLCLMHEFVAIKAFLTHKFNLLNVKDIIC